MNRRQWKSGRIILIVTGVIASYLLIRVRNYDHEMSVFLPKVHPNEPWEFVADFSNMKYLNPTITDFSVIGESGNYEHWKYSVEYSELLSYWPHLSNTAIAHFDVKSNSKTDEYFIYSNHRTCMFMGLYCLDSISKFKCSKSTVTNGANCLESVTYQCPAFLSAFCKREVLYQRNSIKRNLLQKFLN
ncbi:uncharacterized protein LOC126741606 isoform X1 [Anthonomus grandis grandis]|uniref:uncharacterized protein LOC126741606 isoform X1 n=1 Tax=Anthonomus grandis grandis TaxID=2921223 RepID=UPI002166ACB8|nr:uncharacterized protein LOC126741606 isoform X1 [Anthonomus grandis grandis]